MSYVSEEGVRAAQYNAAIKSMCPSVLYRPSLRIDGSEWVALYGDDIQTGVCGIGATPELAMADFDRAWSTALTPDAARTANSLVVKEV